VDWWSIPAMSRESVSTVGLVKHSWPIVLLAQGGGHVWAIIWLLYIQEYNFAILSTSFVYGHCWGKHVQNHLWKFDAFGMCQVTRNIFFFYINVHAFFFLPEQVQFRSSVFLTPLFNVKRELQAFIYWPP